MKKPVCPYNYRQTNLGISREEQECLLVKNTRDETQELLDRSYNEYREIYEQLRELINVSENFLHMLESDKDVAEKKWWLDQRAQLAEAIDNAKKC